MDSLNPFIVTSRYILCFASQSDDRRNDITGEDDRLTRSFH